ncbi:hypothetical protein CKM354_000689000 [Cercospora kikuchii]|uniref:Uncharacterized protein n=1 Tax=Cercospora kikuchii TaxID=84275 RepID=A0A9P3CJ48_9PEZI|nr:uncharacterized protein CKM354_000689000 [Cercospora kikuchii]GIZ43673.1 hypothetical protein CKM354_000689000 [Cercospora kikuchii]
MLRTVHWSEPCFLVPASCDRRRQRTVSGQTGTCAAGAGESIADVQQQMQQQAGCSWLEVLRKSAKLA